MASTLDKRGLTGREITEEIIKYIDERIYNYAVMIDGDWGCGKTYFIKKYLIRKLEEHEMKKSIEQKRNIIYISLYGIKSTDEVSKQVLMESYLAKCGEIQDVLKKGSKIIGSMLPLVFDLIKNKVGFELNKDNVSNTLGEFLQIKDNILIFDDLERCDCPINEILGYINTFVEQEEMKVIIVANQNEIGRRAFSHAQETRYLDEAHSHDMIREKTEDCIIIHQNISENDKSTQGENNPITTNLNITRDSVKKLFAQDASYERIKEKIIGQTIHYCPNLQKIFEKLIKNNDLNDKLQHLLLEQLQFFEEYMTNENHLNLRTFQFFLSKVKGLYSNAISQIKGKSTDAFLIHIIRNSFIVCVKYKNGTYKDDWSKDEEYRPASAEKVDMFDINPKFRFIDSFIIESVLDKSNLEHMFRVYANIHSNDKRTELDYLNTLQYGWATYTDEQVEESIKTILNALKNNKYEITEYPRIIGTLLILEDTGFSPQYLNNALLSMKSNINKSNIYIRIESDYMSADTPLGKRFHSIISDLQEEIRAYSQRREAQTISKYISQYGNWADKLLGHLGANQFEIINITGFLSQINIADLVKKIEQSDSQNINSFRMCINSIYKEHNIGIALNAEDRLLFEFLNCIKHLNQDSFDKIKKRQINYLIKNIKSAIAIYEVPQKVRQE